MLVDAFAPTVERDAAGQTAGILVGGSEAEDFTPGRRRKAAVQRACHRNAPGAPDFWCRAKRLGSNHVMQFSTATCWVVPVHPRPASSAVVGCFVDGSWEIGPVRVR
jgi:hypothetical protein